MAGPVYPDVPKSEGVPDVKRSADNPGTDQQAQMTSDEITVQGYGADEWGIYKANSHELALDADSVISVGFDGEYRVADYPIEEGGFESYDKVALPYVARIVLTKGGKREDRSAFCRTLDSIRRDTELYSVVTPERVYLNCNVTRVSIDRSAEAGAGMIRAEIMLQEIRQEATSSFSNTRDAASADTANQGSAQPKTDAPSTAGVK
ncbi:phage baseplate protein [Novosphingobium colocasiae]|uniref:phage baseplate protein n=1 Tax=Novosphingobium colocasiae TaxID=1256513 RepID=UPI0035AE097F